LCHIGRNGIAYLALFLALGGTAFAAGGKLLTGAEIQDDSLTGADIVESSLAKVPGATNADQLGGMVASSFLKSGVAAGGALDGTYPNPDIATDAVTTAQIKNQTVGLVDLASGAVSAPKLLGGAAATNVWGNGQWAPVNATQRGYLEIRRDDVTGNVTPYLGTGGFETLSYPVPLSPEDKVISHVILDGDPVPDGCAGSFAEPMAAPGHICLFYHPAYKGDSVADVTLGPGARYGRNLRVDLGHDTSGNGCDCAIADVIWAMTPPIN
jgi:hypothetical protein